jgi:hypothetical protein
MPLRALDSADVRARRRNLEQTVRVDSRRLIGYWRNEEHPDYPDPLALVDETWDERERHQVSWFLSHGTMAFVCAGLSPCRVCGQNNGAAEFTDGTYQWPEGLAHYVDEHRVRLPHEFVEHACRTLDLLTDEPTSLDWWLSTTSTRQA